MAINITDLLDKLDALSAWRKVELSQAHFLAENSKNKDAERYLCRAWVLMMYAHCDNFLKESARTYLDYLRSNMGSTPNYKNELIWLVMRGEKNLDASENKYKSLDDYLNSNGELFFDDHMIKEVLKKGSFNYKTLRYFCDWVMQLKYNHSEFRDFCEKLKRKRDCIAHGEESYVDSTEDCLPWHEKTILFMDSLKDALIESSKNARLS